MSAKKQYGKGLSGFMLGLLLATAVIAGVLFFLNKSNKEAFKEETQKELPKPEILTPKSSEPAASAPPAADGTAPAGTASDTDVLGGFIEEQQTASETATTSEPEPAAPDASAAVPPKTGIKPKPEQKPAVKKAEPKPGKTETTKEQPKKEQPKKEQPKKTAEPTPEQILNSGSIEKARENARAETAKKETAKTESAKKTDSRKQPADNEGGRTVLQMGSFNNRESAEAHRAKLAMMGVSSSVVEGEANGRSVYRVQSGRMSSDAARRTQQTLKRNGVDSFARSVK